MTELLLIVIITIRDLGAEVGQEIQLGTKNYLKVLSAMKSKNCQIGKKIDEKNLHSKYLRYFSGFYLEILLKAKC